MKLTPELRRAMENAAVIARMKTGESSSVIDRQATWWPPRQMIAKDKEAIKRVYGG